MPIKYLPELVRRNGKWTIEPFIPPRGAIDWPQFEGKKSTLYVIGCAGFCKIGLTENFEKRFAALDLSNPLPLSKISVRTVPAAGVAYAEAWLHQKFAEFRTKGEWFSVDQVAIKAALPEAARRAVSYERMCREWHFEQEREKRTPEYQAWAKKNYREMLERHKAEYQERLEAVETDMAIING